MSKGKLVRSQPGLATVHGQDLSIDRFTPLTWSRKATASYNWGPAKPDKRLPNLPWVSRARESLENPKRCAFKLSFSIRFKRRFFLSHRCLQQGITRDAPFWACLGTLLFEWLLLLSKAYVDRGPKLSLRSSNGPLSLANGLLGALGVQTSVNGEGRL